MFPNAKRVLHAFSGGLTLDAATEQAPGAEKIVLVDSQGPDQGRHPTYQGDIIEYCACSCERFDLIIADPPYSTADAERYGVKMPNRGRVTAALRIVAAPSATLVWLDQVWPMHRRSDWSCYGHIALVRSTNHRVRLVSLFEAALKGGDLLE